MAHHTYMTVRQFIQALREGAYTSVGSYPKFWLTSDGGTLSHAACLENCGRIARAIRDGSNCGWRVVAYDVNWEDPDMFCAHTNERIESAYAEDKAHDSDLHRGFDSGNYANAYETEDYDTAIAKLSPNRSSHYVAAFTLGFFSSYEVSEMGEHADSFKETLASPAGQRCIKLGLVDRDS